MGIEDLIADARARIGTDDPGGAFFGFLARIGAEAIVKRDLSDAIAVPGALREDLHAAWRRFAPMSRPRTSSPCSRAYSRVFTTPPVVSSTPLWPAGYSPCSATGCDRRTDGSADTGLAANLPDPCSSAPHASGRTGRDHLSLCGLPRDPRPADQR